jgi:sulfite reductase alpha subunit-like flavoprotein
MTQSPEQTASVDLQLPHDNEHILVLYASQTGNSEQAAKDVCLELPSKLPGVTCSHMQLDDFLELKECAWTPFVIIISSSYGVGQAPLGGYRFRDFCDSILLQTQTTAVDSTSDTKLMLKGLSFALLGLGDSKYTTYFQNPTTIHNAMTQAGATLVGMLGKADASGDQLKAISDWIHGLWTPLQTALRTAPPVPSERLLEMQQATQSICRNKDPTFLPLPLLDNGITSVLVWLLLPLVMAFLAIASAIVCRSARADLS